jgi:hypothetical protein
MKRQIYPGKRLQIGVLCINRPNVSYIGDTFCQWYPGMTPETESLSQAA